MSVPDEHELTDALRRGRLSESELEELHAYRARHPQERPALDTELALNQLLDQLPPAPVSSNFTARVLQQVERDARSTGRARGWAWLGNAGLGSWIPKLATIAAAVVAVWFTHHQHELAQRKELARNLIEISRMTRHNPEVLQNFEVIQSLSQVPRDVDRELLAALQ